MTEPLIACLQEVWDDIERVGENLTDDEWARPTDCPGWLVKDHVAHMVGTENMLLGVQPPAGDATEPPPARTDPARRDHVRNDVGTFNEQWVAAFREHSGAETLAAFGKVTRQRLDALRALPAEKWDEEGFTPEGPGPYRQFMAIRVFDCWYHDQDIREAIDRPGLLEGTAADLALARIPAKGLSYVVGKKAAAPQGASVVFEISGAPPIVAAVVVDGRAAIVDAIPAAPTTRLRMDRRTFARLAGGRWTGQRARDEGSVDITGDTALGTRIVENMAFTI